LTYNDPRYLAERHNLDGGDCMATAHRVEKALAKLAQAAIVKTSRARTSWGAFRRRNR